MSVTVAHRARTMPLDDILKIGGLQRMQLLEAFLSDEHSDGPVLIRTNDGKPTEVGLGERRVSIPPKGKRVPRSVAIQLLEEYGNGGFYHNYDQATGLSKNGYEIMSPTQKEFYKNYDLKFRTNYLTHVIDKLDDGGMVDFDAALADAVPD